MKKLLELKSLDTEVRGLLQTVETPAGIYSRIIRKEGRYNNEF